MPAFRERERERWWLFTGFSECTIAMLWVGLFEMRIKKTWFLSFGDIWQKMTQQQAKEQLVDRLEGVSFSLSLSLSRAFGETSTWHCIVWLLLFRGTITTSVQKLTHGNHNYKFQEMWMSVKFLSVSWVRFVLDAKAQIATFSSQRRRFSSQRKREEQLDRVFQEEVFCSFFQTG